MRGEFSDGIHPITVVMICDKCGGESEQDDIIQNFHLLESKARTSGTGISILAFDLHSRCYSMIKNNLRNLFGIMSKNALETQVKELIRERAQLSIEKDNFYIHGN